MTQDEIVFEKEKVCYEQNFQQLRSLNDQMNRIPTIAVTLTGGLWYGASLTGHVDPAIRFGLIILAGFCDLALILACIRTRDVMQSYMEQIKQFNPDRYASGRPLKPVLKLMADYSMIGVYCYLMAIVAALSFLGATYYYWPFRFSRNLGFLALFLFFIINYGHFHSKAPEGTPQ